MSDSSEGKSGLGLYSILLFIGCGLFGWLSFDALFYQYPIYLKDESFLSHAQSTTATVTRDYTSYLEYHYHYTDDAVPEHAEYSFTCGKSCSENYHEGKFARLKYQIDETDYENDVRVVYAFEKQHTVRESVRRLIPYTSVRILYNTEDPNDIRLVDDVIIRDMNSSWFSRHSHWFWIIFHCLIGLISSITAFVVFIISIRGHRLFRKGIDHFMK